MIAMQAGDGKPKRGFESSDPKKSSFELDDLFMRRVRRVVGRDGIDGSISQGDDNGFPVGARALRRIHLEVGVVVADVSVGQAEMVRGNFARDTSLASLASAHGFQRIGSRKVGHVDPCAGELLRELYIALDHR